MNFKEGTDSTNGDLMNPAPRTALIASLLSVIVSHKHRIKILDKYY